MVRLRIVSVTAALVVLASPSIADGARPYDVPAADVPPVVDGALDDPAWTGALRVDDFVARLPVDMAEPSVRTEVRFVHTDRALYVGLRAFDPHPESIRANSMRRDDFAITADDQFVIAIDSFHDRRNGYWFSTNPRGARVDAQFSDEGERFETAWDGVWRAAARIDAHGWTAEVEIPWSTLRFRAADEVVMGINLFRRVPRTNEQLFAPAIPLVYAYGTPNVSAARTYRFRGIRGGARLDLRPFALVGSTRNGGRDRRDSSDAGLFARSPISDSITLAGTLHADFSEVEADENQLNLTRFPVFLPEKRDFFLEDAGRFAFGVPDEAELFFSRTIGLVAGPSGEVATVPIDWGAKITGTAGRVEFGVLSGATGGASGSPGERFDVARARVVLGGRSTVGGFWSRRRAAGVGGHATRGLDLVRFLRHEVRLRGFVARDDDASARRRAWFVALDRGGERAAFTVSALDLAPGFAPALGLVARSGTRRLEAGATLPWFPDRASPIRRFAPGFSFVRYDDRLGDGYDERASVSFGVAWRNDFTAAAEVARQRERLGAPFVLYRDVVIAAGSYERSELRLSAATDPTRSFSGTGEIRSGGLYGGRHLFASVDATWRPNRFIVLSPAVLSDRVARRGARFTATVARIRLGVTTSPRVRIDVLGQYESEQRAAGVGLRFRYDLREGTRVVAAWDSIDRRLPLGAGAPRRTDRAALKFSYRVLF